MRLVLPGVAACALAMLVSGCDKVGDFRIRVGSDASSKALEAFEQAGDGDVIDFGCGFFEIDDTLRLSGVRDVTIRGCSMNHTLLSFARAGPGADGIVLEDTDGVTIEAMTIADTPEDAIRIERSGGVALRRLRALWSNLGEPITDGNFRTEIDVTCPEFGGMPEFVGRSRNGGHGIRVNDSNNLLVEDSEAIGAIRAGISVRQSEDVIIRESRAAFNVVGFAIENTNRADAFDNQSECNSTGFMVFNRTERPFYGDRARIFGNGMSNNNTANFSPPDDLGFRIPVGVGALLLAKDQVEIRENDIRDHGTSSLMILSQEFVADPDPVDDLQINPWPDAVNVHDNVFANAGQQIDWANPLVLRLLEPNDAQGAHIVWDGLLDEMDEDCPFPADVEADERGKPQYRDDPEPECRFNRYKFDQFGRRIQPAFWICIEANIFDAAGNDMVPRFFNFANTVLEEEEAELPDRDLEPHRCEERFGETLPALPAVTVRTAR